MSLYTSYSAKSDAEFLRLVGLSQAAFLLVVEKVRAAIAAYHQKRPARARGRKPSLSLEDRVLLTFVYLRSYPTFLVLGTQFGISESYAHKIYSFIVLMLLQALPVPNDKSLSLESVKVALDVSEQPIERPQQKQQDYYSGKKKQHTIKALLVVCLCTRLILAVRCGKGRQHDYKLFQGSKLPLHKQAAIKADSGFQGIQKAFARAQVPYKGTKKKPLTKEQKKYNRELAQERIVIEHINRECKIFRICQAKYRGKHKNYTRTWKLVAALVNFKQATQHLTIT